MHIYFLLSVLFAFAGRGFGLNIDLGGQLGNLTASQFLAIPDSQLMTDCQMTCAPANETILACGTSDDCLCQNTTVAAVRDCEQCMFGWLIDKNEKTSDPRVGSSSALSAYGAACLASVNVSIPAAEIALTLPPGWNGPFAVEFGLAVTVVTVSTGGLLALAGLYLVSSM